MHVLVHLLLHLVDVVLMPCRYCDYLYGTVAVSAPLFLNVQPQADSSASPSKGSLPSLTAKGKHGKNKGSAKSKTPDKAAALVARSAHLKFTVQEVILACLLRCSLIHSTTHIPTHPPIYPRTYSPTLPITHSLLTYSLTNPMHARTDVLLALTHSLTPLLIPSITQSLHH